MPNSGAFKKLVLRRLVCGDGHYLARDMTDRLGRLLLVTTRGCTFRGLLRPATIPTEVPMRRIGLRSSRFLQRHTCGAPSGRMRIQ